MARAAGVPDDDTEPVASLTWDQVLPWRLDRQQLTDRDPASSMEEVVGSICGLHAQLGSSARMSLRARLDGLDADVIDRALREDRSLVKTWAMRGTLHLLPAAEYPLWQAMLGEYEHYRKGSWLRHFGFADEEELDAVVETIGDVLRQGPLDREALATAVAEEMADPDVAERLRDSWGATLKPASFNGQLCYAPDDGRNVQFVHPEAWLGEYEPVDPDRAKREVTRRYLAAYGPATRGQYARWSGLRPAEAGRRIDALGDEIAVVELDGERQWLLTEDVPGVERAAPTGTVRLLPRFDPYVVGAPREEPAICPDDHVDRVYRSNGWISAVLLVDGRIRGVWQHDRSQGEVEITLEPFGPVDEALRERATAEAERIAEPLGGSLSLEWGSP